MISSVRPKSLRLFAIAVAMAMLSFLLAAGVGPMSLQNALACPAVGESFEYPDDTPLDGLDGGSTMLSGSAWTSPWEAGGTTPTDAFTIQDGKVSIGTTSGTYEIGREFVTTDLGPSAFFAIEMTQQEINTAPYTAGVEFRDATGVVAAFGLDTDGSGAHRFFGKLSDTKVVNASLPVVENTFYWMVGQLDFNQSGNYERLRVWTNPTYQDIVNGTNVAVNIDSTYAIDLGESRTTLGDQVYFVADVVETGTAKTWDDLVVARDAVVLGFPRLDIGPNTGNQQVGYEEWSVGTTAAHSFSTQRDRQDYGLGSGTMTITVEALDGNELLQPVEESLTTEGLADSLRLDGVEATGGIQLTFANLLSDTYLLKSYHHQTELTTGDQTVDVYVSNDGGTNFSLAASFVPTTGDDPAKEVYTWFGNMSAPSGTDFIIRFVPRDADAVVGLNGFVVIPEPGTLLLVATLVLSLLAYARYRPWGGAGR